MAYLICDPTCNALMKQLREADRQRDHLRAQLADAALQVELAEVERNLPWGLTPEEKARLKAERESAIQARIDVRAARRAKEMELFGAYVRPGTWDADLDNYQEPKYEEDVGEGYSIRLVRARDLTWNAYVVLPAGHPSAGTDYECFTETPVHITYSAMEEGRGVYGFYLYNVVKPREDYLDYTRDNHYSVEQTGSTWEGDGSLHVSYEKMRARCLKLVEHFKQLALPPAPAVAAAPAVPAVKKSWAAIVAAK